MIEVTIWASEIASMSVPVDQMYPVSPFETPWSMRFAFRRGRYSDAIADANWKTRTPSSSQRYVFRYRKRSLPSTEVSRWWVEAARSLQWRRGAQETRPSADI